MRWVGWLANQIIGIVERLAHALRVKVDCPHRAHLKFHAVAARAASCDGRGHDIGAIFTSPDCWRSTVRSDLQFVDIAIAIPQPYLALFAGNKW